MNEAGWRAWAEQTATGLAWIDADLRVAWLNPALVQLLGRGTRSAIGQPLAMLLPDPAVPQQAARALAEQRAVQWRALRLEVQGGQLSVDAALQPLAADSLLLEMHVLTPPPFAASPLSASLRGFAHEVKNPLAGLRGAAQLLQRRLADADLKALAGLAIAEADRLAALADRLLRRDGTARLQPTNIHAVLDRVVALLQAEPAPLDVRQDYDPSVPELPGDPARLQQLLLNLARNAREAGARTLCLRTRVEHGVRVGERMLRTALRVDLIDDGAGVPAALRETLFEPLVSGRPDGTGLGLALAREIAHEHRGELRHAGMPGATVFTLLLPLEH